MAFHGHIILRMEAVRQTRRWSTYALRLGYAVVLASVVAAIWWVSLSDPHMDTPTLARRVFGVYRDLLVLLAVGVAPLIVALGSVEDRDDGSLTLLALTGLGPASVVLGKVAARLAGLGVVVLGGLPVACLTVAIGGVSPWEVVNATANGVVLIAAMGGMAGVLATASRRVFAPVLAALTWGWVAFFALPSLFAYALFTEVFLGWRGPGFLLRWLELVWTQGFDWHGGADWLSPVAAMGADGPYGLIPAGISALAIAVLALSARPAFAAATGSSAGRTRDRLRWAGVVGLPLGVLLWSVGVRWPSEPAARALAGAGAVALLVAGTAWWMDLGLWSLGDGARPIRRPQRPVRGNPVAWREARTAGWAGARPWSWWLAGVWAVALLVAWWAAPGNVTRMEHLELSQALLIAGVVASVVAATTSVAAEVSAGTLQLLVGSTFAPHRVVLGKLAAAALFSLPVLALGAGMRGLQFLPWIVAFWVTLALSCMLTALWVRPVGMAWTMNLCGWAAYLMLVPLAELFPGGTALRQLVAPPVVAEVTVSPVLLATSTSGFVAASAVLLALVTWSLARRGAAPR